MENRENSTAPAEGAGKPGGAVPDEDRKRLRTVLLTVLILCGGNGAGLIAGALVWKKAGNIPLAIILLVGITAAAFCAAMLLFKKRNRGSGSGRG